MGTQQLIFTVLASIIGFVVVIFLASILLRGQESSVDSTQILRAKGYLFAAVQNMELDFRNLGSGVDSVASIFPASPIDTLTCQYVPGFDCKFSFYGRTDSTSGTTSLIQYMWRQDGTESVDTDLSGTNDALVNRTMYRLRRVVDGGQVFEVDRVSRFRISVFDVDDNVATNPLAIRRIELDLRVLVPTTQTDEQLEEVRWRTVLRPVNLTRE